MVEYDRLELAKQVEGFTNIRRFYVNHKGVDPKSERAINIPAQVSALLGTTQDNLKVIQGYEGVGHEGQLNYLDGGLVTQRGRLAEVMLSTSTDLEGIVNGSISTEEMLNLLLETKVTAPKDYTGGVDPDFRKAYEAARFASSVLKDDKLLEQVAKKQEADLAEKMDKYGLGQSTLRAYGLIGGAVNAVKSGLKGTLNAFTQYILSEEGLRDARAYVANLVGSKNGNGPVLEDPKVRAELAIDIALAEYRSVEARRKKMEAEAKAKKGN